MLTLTQEFNMGKVFTFFCITLAAPVLAAGPSFECAPDKTNNDLNLRIVRLEVLDETTNEALMNVEYEDGSQASVPMLYKKDYLKEAYADTFSPKVKDEKGLYVYIYPSVS